MKRPRIVLTDAAVTDILEQADWYEQRADQKLAKRWGNAVTSTVLRIVENPRSGSPCPFKANALAGVRRMAVAGFHKHLVFYRLQGRELHVLRVIHGARDLETLF